MPIPRILHQTWKTADLPPEQVPRRQTWLDKHPSWEYRFYDDQACLQYVSTRFPQYLRAYNALKKPVEKADLFRYLVVLGDGGVYADIDTSCDQSLDGLLQPSDTLVVGIEQQYIAPDTCLQVGFVRSPVQLCQWVFAGVAGHPALQWLVDVVAANALYAGALHGDAGRDTLVRTGPAPFTDVMVWFALQGSVRIVPAHIFNPPPKWPTTGPRASYIRHHFAGTWHTSEPSKAIAEDSMSATMWIVLAAVLFVALVGAVLLMRSTKVATTVQSAATAAAPPPQLGFR